ncbi:hypothetical protein AOLI_G00181960 [Acnodon oligacanthus]
MIHCVLCTQAPPWLNESVATVEELLHRRSLRDAGAATRADKADPHSAGLESRSVLFRVRYRVRVCARAELAWWTKTLRSFFTATERCCQISGHPAPHLCAFIHVILTCLYKQTLEPEEPPVFCFCLHIMDICE